jgi:uncharacterized membrane protein
MIRSLRNEINLFARSPAPRAAKELTDGENPSLMYAIMTPKTGPSEDKSGAQQAQRAASASPDGRPSIRLLTNSEGHVLIAGVALTVGYVLWLGFKIITAPDESPALLAMTSLTVMAGRAAGIAYGYTAKLPYATILAISAVAETAAVLIFYPLFVFSCQHLLTIKPLQKAFDRVLRAAEKNQTLIRRYGPIGLFALVLCPIWMTGPIVGCVIGFLLRIPVWLNIVTVLTATYVAIFLWAAFLHHVHEHVSSYGSYATSILVVVVIAIAVFGHVAYEKLRQKS